MKKFVLIHSYEREIGIAAVCKSLTHAQEEMLKELWNAMEREGEEKEKDFVRKEWAAALSSTHGREGWTCGIYPHSAWWNSDKHSYDWKIVEIKV